MTNLVQYIVKSVGTKTGRVRFLDKTGGVTAERAEAMTFIIDEAMDHAETLTEIAAGRATVTVEKL